MLCSTAIELYHIQPPRSLCCHRSPSKSIQVLPEPPKIISHKPPNLPKEIPMPSTAIWTKRSENKVCINDRQETKPPFSPVPKNPFLPPFLPSQSSPQSSFHPREPTILARQARIPKRIPPEVTQAHARHLLRFGRQVVCTDEAAALGRVGDSPDEELCVRAGEGLGP